jgi:hypothetical protein
VNFVRFDISEMGGNNKIVRLTYPGREPELWIRIHTDEPIRDGHPCNGVVHSTSLRTTHAPFTIGTRVVVLRRGENVIELGLAIDTGNP